MKKLLSTGGGSPTIEDLRNSSSLKGQIYGDMIVLGPTLRGIGGMSMRILKTRPLTEESTQLIVDYSKLEERLKICQEKKPE